MSLAGRSIVAILRNALPGFVEHSPVHGAWRIQKHPADWRITPEGYGFWMTLTGPLDGAPGKLLGECTTWPWPLRVARDWSGGPLQWRADVLIPGEKEVGRLEAMVADVCRWRLRPASAKPNPTNGFGDEPELGPWERVLREAFGAQFHSAGSRHRLTDRRGGAALHLQMAGDALALTARRDLPPAAAGVGPEAVMDLLLVANGRQRGGRATLLGEDAAATIGLEWRVDRPNVQAVRAAARRMRAACAVFETCDVLTRFAAADHWYSTVSLVGAGKLV